MFVGGLVAGATGAFFSDTETSTGNTFAAGAIDLGIDNESYYNGVFNADTSWDLSDLTDQLFFDFQDICLYCVDILWDHISFFVHFAYIYNTTI